ncbi:DUF6382 domain-containing protein [Paenibacillus qinlingensis]|uniref:FHA domain-containing protein n=1 Tax=Paenibacillus qinlingensis TaxID=1837343 RepID=A0ABU1NQF9_9BACL|nr:DUF6382 domain-containing protein [Paenibacillus qinlingensis]MDR6549698.1 hypothetical protein [Paenibacillus qinlingensis]
MTEEVFGLCYEFVYRHGHYMELYKEEGLSISELSHLQIRMLEANQVPRLLPLDILEVDAKLRLQYKLSSKRMLTHVLKVESFSVHQFAKLMYAIVSTLDESNNYMLYEINYVLKENFIFIGQDWSDIYLTYVPIDTQHVEEDVFPSIAKLMCKLASHISEEEQDQANAWISMTSNLKSMQAYKDLLLKLMDEPIRTNVPIESYVHELSKVEVEAGLPKAHWKRHEMTPNEHAIPESITYSTKQPTIPNIASLPAKSQNAMPIMPTTKSALSKNSIVFAWLPLQQRAKWIAIAVLIITTAFLWQYYAAEPSTSTFQLIAGITLLLGDVGFILLVFGFPVFSKGEKAQVPSIPHEEAATFETASEPMDIQAYYQNLPMHTTMLNPPKHNATVLLSKLSTHKSGPRLEFEAEGVSKIVPIDTDLFIIGRGDTSIHVNCELEVAGVSRIHAEIIQTSQGYHLRDAGSTNGTYLNDQPLVIYQAYPLKDGDIVRIIRQELTFRL